MTFKIVVANRIHDETLSILNAHGDVVTNESMEPFSREDLVRHCADADALMAFMTESIDDQFLDQCPSLKVIAGALKGYNNIDVETCTARSVLVTIVPDLLTAPTAELTIGLMISLARNFLPGDHHIRSGAFEGWRPRYYGSSIEGSTVGVIGAGAVGQAVLRMLKGFDCKRIYSDKTALPESIERELDATHATLQDVRSRSDFAILALHLMPSTHHIVDDDFLSAMKPGSFLINPGRGSLVDELAIVRALESGCLEGYAADTFEMEDWSLPDRPREIPAALLQSAKTVLTPHIGSAVRSVRQEIERVAAECIVSVANGQTPVHAVNAPAILLAS